MYIYKLFLDINTFKLVILCNLAYCGLMNINSSQERRILMPNTNADQTNEAAIVDGWARIAEEYQPRDLNEHEKAQTERASLAESQAKKASFKLGNPIRIGF
jgi:hypothetical protein